jgi:glycosyltransferase involved in cell wall biosynthesis
VRVLVVTKIFPNALEPHSSTFNRQQFAELGRLCDVEVLATIPWFPLASLVGNRSRASTLRSVPPVDRIAGLDVRHPRFLYVPKVGDAVASPLYALSLLSEIVSRRNKVDVILASWAYPDGAAAVMLGALLGIPVAIKLHGSDINVMGERPVVRAHLRQTFPRAAAIVAVSRKLGERAIELGARRERTHTVANGIDSSRFSPRDRVAARRALGLPESGRVITCVGRLEKEKGVFDLLDAFGTLMSARSAKRDSRDAKRDSREESDVTLALIGDGSARAEVESRARPFGDRVRVLGSRPHAEIPDWIAAADLLTLPSWNEGTPNVVLEALASGRRVVATHVGGVPDVMHSPELGAMVPPRAPDALARALAETLDQPYDPATIVSIAGVRSWAESARQVFDILSSVARGAS